MPSLRSGHLAAESNGLLGIFFFLWPSGYCLTQIFPILVVIPFKCTTVAFSPFLSHIYWFLKDPIPNSFHTLHVPPGKSHNLLVLPTTSLQLHLGSWFLPKAPGSYVQLQITSLIFYYCCLSVITKFFIRPWKNWTNHIYEKIECIKEMMMWSNPLKIAGLSLVFCPNTLLLYISSR